MSKQFKTPIAPPALSSDPTGQVAGEIYYNTVSGALKIFNGSTWSLLTGSGGEGGGTTTSIQVLGSAPTSPTVGTIYFDTAEQTIKTYNGYIWYDVAGPKELLDHVHYTDGYVRTVDYGNYVANNNYIVAMDGGLANTNYAIVGNDDIFDGGNA